MTNLTAEYLRSVLHYDPETGAFTWSVARGNRRAGVIAGSPHADGYLRIRIMGRPYLVHRLAYLYMISSRSRRQNGLPGWTSGTIGLRPEWRYMRIPRYASCASAPAPVPISEWPVLGRYNYLSDWPES